MTLEGLAQHVYCQFLADTGASHSFISKELWETHRISYAPRSDSAKLANGSSTPIIGAVRTPWVKLGSFQASHTFLVVDMPQFHAILGMDFMSEHGASLYTRKRLMRIKYHGSTVHQLSAHSEDKLPEFTSDFIELWTFQSFAKDIQSLPNDEVDDAFLAYMKPELNAASTHSVPGADDPDIQRILAEFNDVLGYENPGGLPPTRYAADGSAIEHTIETAPDVQPFSRPPRPFTAEEHEAVK